MHKIRNEEGRVLKRPFQKVCSKLPPAPIKKISGEVTFYDLRIGEYSLGK